MVGVTDIVLAPLRAGRLALRAADDLNTLAERARRDPDPVEEVRERLDALLAEIGTLTALVGPLHAAVVALIAAAEGVDRTGREIVVGGRDLTEVARSLDGRTAALIAGGADLTAVAQDLAGTLRVFRAVLPRLLDGLDTVEQLEEAVETVADTVEPLAGAAEGVGRITGRLTRRSKS